MSWKDKRGQIAGVDIKESLELEGEQFRPSALELAGRRGKAERRLKDGRNCKLDVLKIFVI